HAADSKYCPVCGRPFLYRAAYVGHLGDYACPEGHLARPSLDVAAREIDLDGLDGARFLLVTPEGAAPVHLRLPGLYNVYNATAAGALAGALGVPPAEIGAGLESFAAAFGRFERARIEVVPGLEQALDRGLELTPATGELVLLPTYTAMLSLRRIIARRGYVSDYWEAAA